ncbi:MAG: hypothetical protein OK454_07365, partial [Thaumarchaeota archaeon]|nr:hypothetical protein [Nitrososphaerota archaeon]
MDYFGSRVWQEGKMEVAEEFEEPTEAKLIAKMRTRDFMIAVRKQLIKLWIWKGEDYYKMQEKLRPLLAEQKRLAEEEGKNASERRQNSDTRLLEIQLASVATILKKIRIRVREEPEAKEAAWWEAGKSEVRGTAITAWSSADGLTELKR